MERAVEDLTGRARIRDAAIRLFGERGIDGASIRDIAAEAGVSSGLVRHHFGSKEALRAACDAYAKERMLQIAAELTESGDLTALDPVALHPVAFPLQLYLVRSMMDGSETATALFLDGVEMVEDWTKTYGIDPKDRRGYAAALAAIKLSVFVFRDQVSKALGEDITTPAGYQRIGQALMEVFSIPIFPPEHTTPDTTPNTTPNIPPNSPAGTPQDSPRTTTHNTPRATHNTPRTTRTTPSTTRTTPSTTRTTPSTAPNTTSEDNPSTTPRNRTGKASRDTTGEISRQQEM